MADETITEEEPAQGGTPTEPVATEQPLSVTEEVPMNAVTTHYALNGENKVSIVTMSNGIDVCRADLNDNGEDYTFSSKTETDTDKVVAPNAMSLANCLLAGNVILGLIPPQNFDPIATNNAH